jgi:hypothetical protein
MDILEVESVRSVLRDVLDVAGDSVLSASAIDKGFEEVFNVDHWVERFLPILGHCVDPDVDVAVHFSNRVAMKGDLMFRFSLPVYLTVFAAEVVVVLNRFEFERLAVMVCLVERVPTHLPVLPS